VISSLISLQSEGFPEEKMQAIFSDLRSRVHCGLILNELIKNALKYAFPGSREGEVSVSLELVPAVGTVCLRVSDTGVGLPTDFDWRQSASLGLRLVQMLTAQMRGMVQIGSGPGTEFQIHFNLNGTPL
jgi:two-component sensor histidine kinase